VAAVKKSAKKPVKKTAVKKSPVKKTGVKKTMVKKTVVKKSVVKKTVAKKTIIKKPTLKKAAVKKTADGIPEQLRDAALKVLDERQAEDILAITLAGRSSLADYLIIASGRGGRQIAAIADHLQDALVKGGAKFVRVEGQTEANWVLVDCGDVIIHLFRPDVRKYYDLDNLFRNPTK
jgi:ribosome-associated protein